jgi:hypothetical protein
MSVPPFLALGAFPLTTGGRLALRRCLLETLCARRKSKKPQIGPYIFGVLTKCRHHQHSKQSVCFVPKYRSRTRFC